MSIVSTFVKFDDGFYYGSPHIEGSGWFLCFDDDEPPELVIQTKINRSPEEILKEVGIKFENIKFNIECSRCFGNSILKGHFYNAKSYFIEISKTPSTKYLKRFNGKFKQMPKTQCVIYEWK
jgi:hypothetical protein